MNVLRNMVMARPNTGQSTTMKKNAKKMVEAG